MDRIALENLTVLGAPPPEVIEIAAGLGVRHVALYAELMPGVVDRPYYSLVTDTALRRATIERMRDLGVGIALLDSFAVLPGRDPADLRATFDILAELGVTRGNTVSLERDPARSFDQTAAIVEAAGDYSVEMTIEPCPGMAIETLDEAIDLITRIGAPHFKVLVDTMHVARTGTRAADIARIDPALFGYIQLCDSCFDPIDEGYAMAAVRDRIVPGEGDLPLVELLAALPAHLIVSAEVPMQRLDPAGVPLAERAAMAVAGARRVLAEADALREA